MTLRPSRQRTRHRQIVNLDLSLTSFNLDLNVKCWVVALRRSDCMTKFSKTAQTPACSSLHRLDLALIIYALISILMWQQRVGLVWPNLRGSWWLHLNTLTVQSCHFLCRPVLGSLVFKWFQQQSRIAIQRWFRVSLRGPFLIMARGTGIEKQVMTCDTCNDMKMTLDGLDNERYLRNRCLHHKQVKVRKLRNEDRVPRDHN